MQGTVTIRRAHGGWIVLGEGSASVAKTLLEALAIATVELGVSNSTVNRFDDEHGTHPATLTLHEDV